jgi:hypothetical protein
MRISTADYQAILARQMAKGRNTVAGDDAKPTKQLKPPKPSEKDLHNAILAYCDSQWPRWKVVYARRDKPSTIPVGCQDMTIFASNGFVYCLELKTETGKQSKEQRDWAAEMQMLGMTVHVVRSMEQFRKIVERT